MTHARAYRLEKGMWQRERERERELHGEWKEDTEEKECRKNWGPKMAEIFSIKKKRIL